MTPRYIFSLVGDLLAEHAFYFKFSTYINIKLEVTNTQLQNKEQNCQGTSHEQVFHGNKKKAPASILKCIMKNM